MIVPVLALLCLVSLCSGGAVDVKIKCGHVGATYPTPGSCSNYAECSKEGVLQVKSCKMLERYDVKTKKCERYWSSKCAEVQCLEGDKAPVAGNCKKYRYCEGGTWKEGSCHLWYKFDPTQKACRNGYDCKSTPECDKEGATKPTKDNDCIVHLKCKNSKWVEDKCFMGYYNVKTSQCDSSVSCECKSGDQKPIKGDCTHFMACDQGKFAKKSCSFGHRYQQQTKRCVWWYSVKC